MARHTKKLPVKETNTLGEMRKTVRGVKSAWKNENYVDVYVWLKEGKSERDCAKLLGVTYPTWWRWKKHDRTLRRVIIKARKAEGKVAVEGFKEYLYDRLPKHLRRTWDMIMRCEDDESVVDQVEAMLEEHGKRGRQHLFLYALIQKDFNLTHALRSVQIPRKTFEYWLMKDPSFGQLVQEIHDAKKDMFESALVKLVKAGNPAAILFANRTLNADRGYNPGKKLKVEVDGKVLHGHKVVGLDDLKLPVEERRKLLDAYRKAQEEKKELPEHQE